MNWMLSSLFVISSIIVAPGSSARASETSVGRKPASARSAVYDVVKKVREDDDGVVILFEKNTGSYYLRRDLPEFDVCKKKLQESLSGKKPVSVTVDSSQLNILEVK
ncbi:hypothetical protein [Bdellovibrio svalbardensis]|uniref:KTSC domain-containing protein n=1 Tax=Bdellovibrio svalbardensis TaxID=2972972 RepID=A0ABT6DH74_9BACT|nr:hypothetical protein [Bdellovibrio svalbardensis]MDG0815269.1 hypothetical protein [Bdellovibrio svalbardensis]